jgi:hypothetical protein
MTTKQDKTQWTPAEVMAAERAKAQPAASTSSGQAERTQAVPVDWQALAISRYERVQELLQQLDKLVADYSRDTEVLRGQVKYAEQQRDEAVAALKVMRALSRARTAIARMESRAQ